MGSRGKSKAAGALVSASDELRRAKELARTTEAQLLSAVNSASADLERAKQSFVSWDEMVRRVEGLVVGDELVRHRIGRLRHSLGGRGAAAGLVDLRDWLSSFEGLCALFPDLVKDRLMSLMGDRASWEGVADEDHKRLMAQKRKRLDKALDEHEAFVEELLSEGFQVQHCELVLERRHKAEQEALRLEREKRQAETAYGGGDSRTVPDARVWRDRLQ